MSPLSNTYDSLGNVGSTGALDGCPTTTAARASATQKVTHRQCIGPPPPRKTNPNRRAPRSFKSIRRPSRPSACPAAGRWPTQPTSVVRSVFWHGEHVGIVDHGPARPRRRREAPSLDRLHKARMHRGILEGRRAGLRPRHPTIGANREVHDNSPPEVGVVPKGTVVTNPNIVVMGANRSPNVVSVQLRRNVGRRARQRAYGTGPARGQRQISRLTRRSHHLRFFEHRLLFEGIDLFGRVDKHWPGALLPGRVEPEFVVVRPGCTPDAGREQTSKREPNRPPSHRAEGQTPDKKVPARHDRGEESEEETSGRRNTRPPGGTATP